MTRKCSVGECDATHYAKSYCQKHYLRVRSSGDPSIVREGHRYQTADVAQRLAERTTPEGDCLIYTTKRKTRSGHAVIGRDGETVGVHRAAWELANGPIPPGLHVLHRCDTPLCVKVEHLFLGTIADNNADRDQKGRHVALRGADNGFSKLTEDSVRQILARLAAGATQRQLAAEFGVSQYTIWSIRAGRTWRHVSQEGLAA